MAETKSILMVEDNTDNADLATWMLEDAGYAVTAVTTAEDGIERLQQQAFDLVLMDISLPGMDGKDAIAWIRAHPTLAAMPVIALTAHAVLNERDAIMASGADCIVTKPIDEDAFLKTLAERLQGSAG